MGNVSARESENDVPGNKFKHNLGKAFKRKKHPKMSIDEMFVIQQMHTFRNQHETLRHSEQLDEMRTCMQVEKVKVMRLEQDMEQMKERMSHLAGKNEWGQVQERMSEMAAGFAAKHGQLMQVLQLAILPATARAQETDDSSDDEYDYDYTLARDDEESSVFEDWFVSAPFSACHIPCIQEADDSSYDGGDEADHIQARGDGEARVYAEWFANAPFSSCRSFRNK